VPFGCSLHGELQRILYGRRWWLPPSPGHDESCVSKCPWLVLRTTTHIKTGNNTRNFGTRTNNTTTHTKLGITLEASKLESITLKERKLEVVLILEKQI
jgi:hypothetical protein